MESPLAWLFYISCTCAFDVPLLTFYLSLARFFLRSLAFPCRPIFWRPSDSFWIQFALTDLKTSKNIINIKHILNTFLYKFKVNAFTNGIFQHSQQLTPIQSIAINNHTIMNLFTHCGQLHTLTKSHGQCSQIPRWKIVTRMRWKIRWDNRARNVEWRNCPNNLENEFQHENNQTDEIRYCGWEKKNEYQQSLSFASNAHRLSSLLS